MLNHSADIQNLMGFSNVTLYPSSLAAQQTRNTEPMLIQCWVTVFDADPTLKQHWLGVPCLLGGWVWGSFNPLTAKLFNLNFHSLEIVSR